MNRLAVAAVAAVALSPVGLIAVATVMMLSLAGSPSSEATTAATPVACGVTVDPGATAAGLDPEQVANAQVFIAEGKRRGLEPKAWVAAVAAGKVESQMRNLPYGDGTSIGVLQLIDDHGSVERRRDPLFSVSWFYNGVQRFKAPTYTEMPVGALAQRQQRSAFPFRYAEEEAWATAVVAALDGSIPATCAPLASGPWTAPLALGAFRLSSDFGPRSSPGGIGSTNHSGLDFAAPDGTVIYAASAGRVVAAGSAGGYGNLVRVAHADGVETYYAHQSKVSVTVGDVVEPGDPLGFVGSTGNSTGNHLHFEVRISGTPTDPFPWLVERGAPLETAA